MICVTFYSLAEELLAKESIGLPDIIKILGDRPYPMKETVKEYLQEMMERKEKEDSTATASSTEEKKDEQASSEAEKKDEKKE